MIPALPESPMVLVNVMSPSPAEEFTFKPPSSSVAPSAPVKVTFPVPEVIVKISSFPPSVSIAPWKVTAPAPVPVLIVVVPSFARSTPEVLKFTASPEVVNVTALLEAFIFIFPPVAASSVRAFVL